MNTALRSGTSTTKPYTSESGVEMNVFSILKEIPEDSAVSIINELYRLISYARKKVDKIAPFDDDFSLQEKELLADILENIELNTYQDKHRLDKLTQELNDTFDQVAGFGRESTNKVGKSESRHRHTEGMQTGTVKFFNETKGFGFIKPDNTGDDIFVHASGLKDQIRENDRVKFNIERGKKGLNAVNTELSLSSSNKLYHNH